MNDMAAGLDPILEARLDLLAQVLDEVKDIRTAMVDQTQRLETLAHFLRRNGDLTKLHNSMLVDAGDAETRLKVLVQAGRDQLDTDLLDHDPEDQADEADHATSASRKLAHLNELLKELEAARVQAFRTFNGLQAWSVAALDEERLKAAIERFDHTIREIRSSEQPWRKYEEQLRDQGARLFNDYFELLGSMAVRGLASTADLADESEKLLNLLLKPRDSIKDPPRFPAPNLLTRSEHVQLGYQRWSLWAMPLIGREAGLHLIRQGTFGTVQIAGEHQVICADTYAAHVLGPSYVAAALFLELDPDGLPVGNSPSDPVRAELLLELLPQLADEPQRPAIAGFTQLPRAAWEQAREAIGAPPIKVSDEVREVTVKFRGEVDQKFPEGAYDLGNLATRIEEAEGFASGAQRVGTGAPRDVLVSMWWARIKGLADCPTIDASARRSMSPALATTPGTPSRAPTVMGRTQS